MGRSLKDYVVIGLKGVAMGAADVVPGVSGGTIAFISGIYEELLTSISNIHLDIFKTFKKEGFKKAWEKLNGGFLASLLIGIFISIITLAKLISWLLDKHSVLLWSFFFGLVFASIIYIGKQITKWNAISITLLLVGAMSAYLITTLNPMVSENSSPLFMFLAGVLAICAMILPGISGSFILVLLGAYQPVLTAVNEKDLTVIMVIGMGAIVGLLTFSKILKWLFTHYKNYMLAILTGFILGSLNKIWPWKKALTYKINSKGEQIPFNELSVSPMNYQGESQLFYAIVFAFVGFGLLILLEKIAVKNN